MAGMAILLSGTFALAAGLAAYLITYEEYRQHFIDRRRVHAQSLHMAIVAALAFLILGLIGMALFSRAVS